MKGIAQCSAIDTILYFPRRLTHSATMKKDGRQVRRVWKCILVVEGGGGSPRFVFVLVFLLVVRVFLCVSSFRVAVFTLQSFQSVTIYL